MFQKSIVTKLMTITLSLTDFQKSFTDRFNDKFAVKWFAKDPIPHLKRVATLPCEMLMSENKRQFETDIVTNDKSQGTVVKYN